MVTFSASNIAIFILLCMTAMTTIQHKKKKGALISCQMVNQLRTAIMSMCRSTTTTQPTYWISVPNTSISTTNLRHASTLTFTIPNIIPSNASKVLILVGTHNNDLKIFTQIGTTPGYNYMHCITFIDPCKS